MLQIEVSNLSKSYGKKEVLNNVHLKINAEKYNFITGVNGIGKSTFIKCLNGIIDYQGYINNDCYNIAYCPEKVAMPDYITLKNFLYLLGKTNNISFKNLNEKIDYLMNVFGILDYQNTPIIKLSKGTKQKILIIQCLMKDADVYIFDEPVNGLDDISQNVFFNELKKLKNNNKLVLIITHQINCYPFKEINQIRLNNE